jgi:hypothetical protein
MDGGQTGSAYYRPPIPGQQLADAIDRVVGDAHEDVAQIGLRIERVHFGGLDEGVHCGGPDAAGIGAGEQVIFARQRNLAVILPISGRISPSIIAGIPCAGEARAAFRSSSARRASSYTSS